MLPQALQRAERPAEALLGERARSVCGASVQATASVIVGDSPAGALDGDGEVLVLGERVDREAADLLERRAAPGADRAGHDHDRVEPRQRAPLEILRGDIFDRLPAGDEVDPVADLGVAGDRADLRIGEPAGEPRDRLRLELGVGVERDDDLAVGELEAAVERMRLAAIGQASAAARAARPAKAAATIVAGPVARAVVDHDHLDARRRGWPARGAPTASITRASL